MVICHGKVSRVRRDDPANAGTTLACFKHCFEGTETPAVCEGLLRRTVRECAIRKVFKSWGV